MLSTLRNTRSLVTPRNARSINHGKKHKRTRRSKLSPAVPRATERTASLHPLPRLDAPPGPTTITSSTEIQRPIVAVEERTIAVLRHMPLSAGAIKARDRSVFEELAQRADVPGASGVLKLHFLVARADTLVPRLYLINSNTYQHHYDFATHVLGTRAALPAWTAKTYFTDRRKNLAGTIVAYDNYVGPDGSKGLYAVEFWPSDPVKAIHVAKALRAIKLAMPFAADRLYFHPTGDTQKALLVAEENALRRRDVRSIRTTELFAGLTFSALSLGESYGVLRVLDAASDRAEPGAARDIVVAKALSERTGRVAGILSETPQTPLSPINQRARQSRTPNAYLRGASTDPRIISLVGKLVRFAVSPDGFELREATPEEAERHLEAIRPKEPQVAAGDLSRSEIVDLDALGYGDARAYGAETANLAELRRVLPRRMVPDGYGIPFALYDDFMRANDLYGEVRRMMTEPTFQESAGMRGDALRALRERMCDAKLPEEVERRLNELEAMLPPGRVVVCRPSANVDALPGVYGAGPHVSFAHRPDRGSLERTVKQVWASLWSLGAFEERELLRIDHLSAAMGVTVQVSRDDERVSGFAAWKAIYSPSWPGFYVRAQLGEALVASPDPRAAPDELLISAIGPRGEYETEYLRRSSLTFAGAAIMSRADIGELVVVMEKLQQHWRRLCRAEADPTFGVEVAFRVDSGGKLGVKQVRPVTR